MKIQKPKHCNGCKFHHSAGRRIRATQKRDKYNSWCCHYGKPALQAVGRCKLDKFRERTE